MPLARGSLMGAGLVSGPWRLLFMLAANWSLRSPRQVIRGDRRGYALCLRLSGAVRVVGLENRKEMGSWLRAERQARQWDVPEMDRQIRRAARSDPPARVA